jgi:hypothetical protein
VPDVRLVFTSDLHLEHHPEVTRLVAARARALAADILVIAGDLGGQGDAQARALGELAEGAPHVAFVPGNHDLWSHRGTADSRARYLELLPAACARAGVIYLPGGPVDCQGVTLVGQTGWYDFSLRDRRFDDAIPLDCYRRGQYERLSWTDTHLVRWPGLDPEGLTAWMTERLAHDLALAPRDRPAVVVTHMLPWGELTAHRRLPWAFVRGFLGAASLGQAIGAAVDDGLPVVQAICGHSHFGRRAVVRSPRGAAIPAALAPIGTPREARRMGFTSLDDLIAHRLRVVDIAVPAHARARLLLAAA